MRIAVAIMAGGKGERFWPKSRQNLPKQFLSLTDDGKTMLQLTAERVARFVDIGDIFVITNSSYFDLVSAQLPSLPKENILGEPVARNTAPCISLAAVAIEKKFGNSIMITLPSDHLIDDVEEFINIIKKAIDKAGVGANLVTLGITPSYPETGYGYIKLNTSDCDDNCFPVLRFVEKPNIEKAEQYIAEGGYLWNSGMFVWQTSVILEWFRKLMPDIYTGSKKIQDAYLTEKFDEILFEEFSKFPSESVDYGIMEKADSIYAIPSAFGWDDVGSWLAMERISKKDELNNVCKGDIVLKSVKNCTVIGDDRLIAAIGIEDLIVVDSPDALLICHKNDAQNVKVLISKLKKEHNKYL